MGGSSEVACIRCLGGDRQWGLFTTADARRGGLARPVPPDVRRPHRGGLRALVALEDAGVAMDSAVLVGSTTSAELRQAVTAQSAWPGVVRARRAIELTESPLETRGRLRMLGAGPPAPQLQVEIRTGGRLVAVVDAWFDDAAVAVECDGRVKYTDPWRDRSPERVLWRRSAARTSCAPWTSASSDRRTHLGAAWPGVESRLRSLVLLPRPTPRLFAATARTRGVRRSA